jgi:peptidoglycan/LPS O-acetylase OafA/YrhL
VGHPAALLLVPCLFHRNGAELAVAILWGYLILSFAETPRAALAWFNELPDISYGVYLYAWPISKLLLFYLPDIGRSVLVLDTFALSVVLGTLSWYAVEKPFIALKTRRARARPLPT